MRGNSNRQDCVNCKSYSSLANETNDQDNFHINIIFPTIISFAQTKMEVDSLLIEIGKIENSKYITKNSSAIKLNSYGDKSLKVLASYFSDTNQTSIRSECHSTIFKR